MYVKYKGQPRKLSRNSNPWRKTSQNEKTKNNKTQKLNPNHGRGTQKCREHLAAQHQGTVATSEHLEEGRGTQRLQKGAVGNYTQS
jgi:hypothetical protein